MEDESNPAREGSLGFSRFDAAVQYPHGPHTPAPVPSQIPDSAEQHDDSTTEPDSQPQNSENHIPINSPVPHMLRHETIQYYPYHTDRPKELLAEIIDIRARLPAPFPTPIAFSYTNFHSNCWGYPQEYGIRSIVGKELVGAMLRFYFPGSKWKFRVLWNEGQSVVRSVPWGGTSYLTVSSVSEHGKGEGHADETVEDAEEEQIALLAVIATARHFWEHDDRTQPTPLAFAEELRSADGSILLSGKHFQRGHVVFLCDRGAPPRLLTMESLLSSRVGHPRWEFYTFDASREDEAQIVPWFGQTRSKRGYGTNSFSLANDEAEKVHALFESISGWSVEDWEAIPKFEMQPRTRRETPAAKATPVLPQPNDVILAQRTRNGGVRASRSRISDVRADIAPHAGTATFTPAPANSQSILQTPAAMEGPQELAIRTTTPPKSLGVVTASNFTTPVAIPYHPFRGQKAIAAGPAPIRPLIPALTVPPTPALSATLAPQPAPEENETMTYLRQFGIDSIGRVYNKAKGGSVGPQESQRVRQLAQGVGYEIPGPTKNRKRNRGKN